MWEETVLSDEELDDIADEGDSGKYEFYEEFLLPPNYKEIVAKAQAEKSYKAGIKEVIDWIEENRTKGAYKREWDNDFNYEAIELVEFRETAWQAKLRSWGIEG